MSKTNEIEVDWEQQFNVGYPWIKELKMNSPYEPEYLVARDLYARGVLWALDLNGNRVRKILLLTATFQKEKELWRTMKPEASPFG